MIYRLKDKNINTFLNLNAIRGKVIRLVYHNVLQSSLIHLNCSGLYFMGFVESILKYIQFIYPIQKMQLKYILLDVLNTEKNYIY